MTSYRRLSRNERDEIANLKNRGWSLRKIAQWLGRCHSSLSRELRRNHSPDDYYSSVAQLKAQRRLKLEHHNTRKLESDFLLQKRVIEQLKAGWSPEIIAGRLQRENGRTVISHEAIYQWIYAEEKSLIAHLVRSRPRRRPRHTRSWPKRLISHRVSIAERPGEVNRREVPGHWETDTVWGSGRAALQVLVERQTRFVQVRKIPNKTAHSSYEALAEILSRIKPVLRQSVTYDNGVENARHYHLNERFNMKSYFCQPFHAWEKGTVENTNGLIRRFLPKKTNFDTIPPQTLLRIESWLNQRPRKCLNFKTSAEAFASSGALDY